MKSARPLNGMAQRARALDALKAGIVAGAVHDYERLVDAAMRAGATEEEIDLLIHDALAALFESAEQPVGPRELAYLWPAGRTHG